jgi:hypothetical protein
VLPETSLSSDSYSVVIGEETVSIPYRIYHDTTLIDLVTLTQTQYELIACLLTRHHSGFVREEYLSKILGCNHEWVPPFIVQLVGEYVVEIIRTINDGIDQLDPGLYQKFLIRNPSFYETTKQRVYSYWDCYHRAEHRGDYAGFRILKFFDNLTFNSRE